ncbi:MAG: glycyl-radical enzyme activating protein [Actinomycetota bacterium]
MGRTHTVGYVNDIQFFSLSDGPGIRTTVFLKGCLLNCRWCHNPEGKRRFPEVLPYRNNCSGCGKCLEVCPTGAVEMDGPCLPRIRRDLCIDCFRCVAACPEQALVVWGKLMTVGEVLAEAEKDKPFYKHSGGGLTVSGGEPLAQPEFTYDLLAEARERGMNTALDTCGFVAWEVLERMLPVTDHFLLDLKHMDPEAHRSYCGAPNDVILANAQRLAEEARGLRFRIPLIPGFNDGEENLARTADFIHGLCHERKKCEVDVLPYHPYAGAKYRIFGLHYPFPEGEGYPEERLYEIVRVFTSRRIAVTVGG